MMLSHLISDFNDDPVGVVDGGLKDLNSFADGYDAGYQDGQKDCLRDQHQKECLLEALQALHFTYVEARGAAIGELAEVVTEIFEHLFPDLTGTLSVQSAMEGILAEASDRRGNGQELFVAPSDYPLLSMLLSGSTVTNVLLTEDPKLSAGQCRLVRNGSLVEVDCTPIVQTIRAALTTNLQTYLGDETDVR